MKKEQNVLLQHISGEPQYPGTIKGNSVSQMSTMQVDTSELTILPPFVVVGRNYTVFKRRSHLIQTQVQPMAPEKSLFFPKGFAMVQGEQPRYRSPCLSPNLCDRSPTSGGYKAKMKTQHKHRLLQ